MKINEIQNVSIQNVIDGLKQNNYEKVGEGSKSYIFYNKDLNQIAKVTYRPDDCWYKFAHITMKYPNKHFPVIYDVKTFGNNYVAYMENLQSMNGYNDSEYQKVYELFEKMKYLDTTTLYDALDKNFEDESISKLSKNYEYNLIQSIAVLIVFKGNCKFDLHPYNFMKRGSTIVIVDPWD